MDYPTLQESFDSWVGIPKPMCRMLNELEAVDKKHLSTDGDSWSDEYYDDLETVAEKYGLDFVHPKYARGLTVAASSTKTIH